MAGGHMIAFGLIIAFFVVLLFTQLPVYITESYGNYIVLALVAFFSAILFISLKGK